MHIETLKTFCDLVDTGSFSKAARENYVSQSAVSQQLRTLEAHYDRRLVERGPGRPLLLTDAGRLLYPKARPSSSASARSSIGCARTRTS
jgi:DNA-binding transcriptional LysR family regulator